MKELNKCPCYELVQIDENIQCGWCKREYSKDDHANFIKSVTLTKGDIKGKPIKGAGG